MQFDKFASLIAPALRLRDASAALAAAAGSLGDEPQVFTFAGATFTGQDAADVKRAMMLAIGRICDAARAELREAGILFPGDDEKPMTLRERLDAFRREHPELCVALVSPPPPLPFTSAYDLNEPVLAVTPAERSVDSHLCEHIRAQPEINQPPNMHACADTGAITEQG